jgi:hypothetical protein
MSAGRRFTEGAIRTGELIRMKKLTSLMLGLALACTTVTVTFAQQTPKKAGKKKSGKKKKGSTPQKGGGPGGA